jgi:hypothetical protein
MSMLTNITIYAKATGLQLQEREMHHCMRYEVGVLAERRCWRSVLRMSVMCIAVVMRYIIAEA